MGHKTDDLNGLTDKKDAIYTSRMQNENNTNTPTSYFYQELLDIWQDKEQTVYAKYIGLYRVFNEAIHDKTREASLNFSGPFARMDYLCKVYEVDESSYHRINSFRARARDIDQKAADALHIELPHDLKTLVDFIHTLYKEAPPQALTNSLPRFRSPKEKQPVTKNYIRVAVSSWDQQHIYGQTAEEDSQSIQINYIERSIIGDWSYLEGLLCQGLQLNIIHPELKDGIYYPELIILEPDYLIDITAIANCFETYGTSHLSYLIQKIKPMPNSSAILLGNLAGQLLDEACYQQEEEIPYTQSIQSFFKRNSLNLATCPDMSPEFHQKAQEQKLNIRRMIQVLDQEVKHFSNGSLLVEPSFFCEMLGIQGRMDLLQTDMRFLLEQKSGNRAFNSLNHQEKHYVQVLLYQAILHYSFGIKNKDITSILLYSKFSDGIIKEGAAPKLLFEALKVRNKIVMAEKAFSQGGLADLLQTLTPEAFNIKQIGGRLWEQYIEPQLDQLLAPIHEASGVTFDYFSRFLTFLEKEHMLAKTGNNTQEISGFSSIWNATIHEKKQAGNLYDNLTIVDRSLSDDHGGYESITLQTTTDDDYFLPNFRKGDIVILYTYPKEEVPDARKSIVFRGSIQQIEADTIQIRLRSPQRNKTYFSDTPSLRWAIEHDLIESTFNALYKAVYSFLTADTRRKELILNTRKPERNSDLKLLGQYGELNEMVLKAKQATDYFLLVGPPGTGKTSFGLMHILQEELLEKGTSVLLAAYTNRAVDEICGKLVEQEIPFIRIGSDLTTDTAYKEYLLSNRMASCKNTNDIRELITKARVIVGTTTSISSNVNLFMLKQFSLAIIDEASQILEPHILSLLCAKHNDVNAIQRFVLIGDHKQLPAIVQQSEADSQVNEPSLHKIGLNNCRNSLFERLIKLQNGANEFIYTLKKQGRMHPEIAQFPNLAFYKNQLQAVPVEHQKAELSFSTYNASNELEKILATQRVTFFASHFPPSSTPTKENPVEGQIIASTIHAIWNLYVSNNKAFDHEKTLGVIVPYRKQIALIRNEIERLQIEKLKHITIDTVERYQGSQRDIIIYGFTVWKPYQLNFLTGNQIQEDETYIDRKLNVALTRAREQLILVGNPQILQADTTFRHLIHFIKSEDCYFERSR